MTGFSNILVKCTLCGKTSDQCEILSVMSFGGCDLDSRPPPNARHAMEGWIQFCPYCGYCTQDISERLSCAAEVVQSKAYLANLMRYGDFSPPLPSEDGREFVEPSISNKFLCFALIQEARGENAFAGWAYLHAAWGRDDSDYPECVCITRDCRKKAIAHFEKCLVEKKRFFEQQGGEYAVLADLYRRTGQFEKAVEISWRGMKDAEPIIADTLRCEIRLANASDDRCHRLDEK